MDGETLYILFALALVIGGNVLYRWFMHKINKMTIDYQNKRNHEQSKREQGNTNQREKL